MPSLARTSTENFRHNFVVKETWRSGDVSPTLPGVKETSLFLNPLRLIPQVRAEFVKRVPDIETSTDKAATLAQLGPAHKQAASDLGFCTTYLAEQIHGAELAIISKSSPALTVGIDGLLTAEADILLGIHVADCGPIYLADLKTGALALLHSGKKGTERNILGLAVAKMALVFGSDPTDLTVVLGPCIRPPHYEIDIAAQIREQALAAGVPGNRYFDSGLCTASDLSRFYSYRAEKGNTGRHLALLGRLPS